jgi:hypothetical protein
MRRYLRLVRPESAGPSRHTAASQTDTWLDTVPIAGSGREMDDGNGREPWAATVPLQLEAEVCSHEATAPKR